MDGTHILMAADASTVTDGILKQFQDKVMK